jgi:hypothetical protein
MFGTWPCILQFGVEPNGDLKEYTQFCHLRGKNDHRRPIGAPQGDFGQRGSGANNLPPEPFIFFRAASVSEVVRSQAKKSPADTMRGLKEGVVASSSLRENMFQLRIRALDTRPKYHLL